MAKTANSTPTPTVVPITAGNRKRSVSGYHPHPLDSLPFMRSPRDGQARDFWSVPVMDSFEQNYQIGQCFGRAMVNYLREHEVKETPTTLGWTVCAMARKGVGAQYDGMIMGFMSVIALAVMGRAVA